MKKKNPRKNALRKKKHRKNPNGTRASRKFGVEPLEDRIVLTAPQFVSVQPNGGEVFSSSTDVLHTSPSELTIRFDQNLDGSAESLDGIMILRNGVEVTAVSRDLGLLGNTVILRFADVLPEDTYSISVSSDLRSASGDNFQPGAVGNRSLPVAFEVDLGTKVSAIVPQPVSRSGGTLTHSLNQIDVYFNDDMSTSGQGRVTDPAYYDLILTQDTVTNTDDAYFEPTSAVYSQAENKVTLSFSDDLHNLAASRDGTFRLRVGTNEPVPSNTPLAPMTPQDADGNTIEPQDSFAGAYVLPTLSGNSQIVSASIEPQSFPLDFSGSTAEPGQRPDLFSEADATDGITTLEYNFQSTYGTNANNLITEPQRQRAREALELFSSIAGVDVIETADSGTTIATGDPFLSDPLADEIVLSNSVVWNDEAYSVGSQGQPSYFSAILGSLIGVRPAASTPSADDLSSGLSRFLATDGEGVFPTNDVLVNIQHFYRRDSVDIDLYKFDVTGSESGLFTAEVLAERSSQVSQLDSVLRLYRETGGGRELVAQNDDYFSEDAYLQLSLEPGTYYVGVSSTGNDQYDPSIAGTGFGGTSQGDYELRLDFRADISDSLLDTTGVAFDGDGDGTPGGVYNFWFRAADPAGAEGRNELQELSIRGASGGDFTINFDGQVTPAIAFDASAADVQSALESLSNIDAGDISVTGANLPDGPVQVEFTGALANTDAALMNVNRSGLTDGFVVVSTLTSGRQGAKVIYVDKSDANSDNLANAGTLANPFNTIYRALNTDINGQPQNNANAAQSGDIVRIIGSGSAYEVGLNAFNQPLADGAKLDIPNDVTVMVEAGAQFNLRRSAIIVGSSAVGIDHSLAALQVLGTPSNRVTFTALNSASARRGDWGGILFAGDLDQDSHRDRYEEKGIFLNHIGQADISLGGGVVNIGSIPQEITPIDIRDARPTIRYNNLTTNLVAAIAATPDSFEETNFHSSEFQSTRFTSDYTRIGPDIQDNTLADNTINGLFIRINTPAGDELVRQTVSGRWDDTDIVHVLSEVLEVRGTPGGPTTVTGAIVARTDARLAIDPNVIVKLDAARIEVATGAQLIAEGIDGQQVTFTSINDDRFGASGSFDTSNNGNSTVSEAGDWGGLYAAHGSKMSLDHVLVTHAGGLSAVEGTFRGFNPIEIHQAQARIANSTFVDNASGLTGQVDGREGRGINAAATVFVRGAQPIILSNRFLSGGNAEDTEAADALSDVTPAISINANSLTRDYVTDYGRNTGDLDRLDGNLGNQGPLIRGNRLDGNDINGMLIRGEALDTESVWDDTDIVHVLFDPIYVGDFNTYGGLRLESAAEESLVVKLGDNGGLNASGLAGFTDDSVGGSVHVIGQPGRPVVLTSIADDTAGAGKRLDGSFQNDTVRDGLGSVQPTGGLDIVLNYSLEVAGNPLLVAALEEAARFWESQLTDDITISFDVVMDNLGQTTLATAGADGFGGNFDSIIQAMQIDAASDETELLDQLPRLDQVNIQVPPGQNVTVANQITVGLPIAKALGLNNAVSNVSQTVDGATRDGLITMNTLQARSSTIADLVPIIIHEIGHTLGFNSNIPGDGNFNGSFTFSIWDLFRMAPGAGGNDFTNNPRVLDANFAQVMYDGGIFDPVGIDIPGIAMGDVPSDVNSPAHWAGLGVDLGIMTPTGDRFSVVRDNDLRALGLMGWDLAEFSLPEIATAGDWTGISLDSFSNDRNVDSLVEIESSDSDASGANSIPNRAEFLGNLAASEYEGDENLRLGFEVHGVLNSPGDVDVYSFKGFPGTEIWLDIDHSASSLDGVLELVDVNGQRVALSDNSIDGAADLVGSGEIIPDALVDPDSYYPTDHFSVNPHDPGMRLTLNGQDPNVLQTYYIRMSSNGGLTQGAYELNVRLSEIDENPGSTVRFADIRFAENGITADGVTTSSPLQADFVEPGDTTQPHLALNVGSLYETKNGEISISGVLEAPSVVTLNRDPSGDGPGNGPFERNYVQSGVDWYQFQSNGPFSLDIDYADGADNPDTFIAVWQVGTTAAAPGAPIDILGGDAQIVYNLIWYGSSSDVQDDRGDRLAEGGFGPNDPFLGPIIPDISPNPFPQGGGQIIPGGVVLVTPSGSSSAGNSSFLVAVTSEGIIPEELSDQYAAYNYLPTDSSRPVDGLEPELLNDFEPAPFRLDDLTLYVATSQYAFGLGTAELQTVNPFTGAQQEDTRPIREGDADFGLGSIAMRPDGTLISLTLGEEVDTAGNFLTIDWAETQDEAGNVFAAVENIGDDEIVGFDEVEGDPDPTYEEFGDGIQFFGLHVNETIAYGVGDRGLKNEPDLMDPPPMDPDLVYLDNLVYAINAYGDDTGTAASNGPVREDDPDAGTYFGAIPGGGTDIVEIARFDTEVERNETQQFNIEGATGGTFQIVFDGENSEDIAFDATTAEISTALLGMSNIDTGTVRVSGSALPDGPIEIEFLRGLGFMNVSTIQIDTTNLIGGTATVSTLVQGNIDGAGPGGTIHGLVESFGTFYGVSDRGNLYSLVPSAAGAPGTTTFIEKFGNASFAGLELGSPNADGGAFTNTLFAITSSGELFAFDTGGNQTAPFEGGELTVQTGLSNVQGLAFSTLDENLWSTFTGGAVFNSGSATPGLRGPGNQNTGTDFNFPGGAHGTFDLKVDLTNSIGAGTVITFDYELRTEHNRFNDDETRLLNFDPPEQEKPGDVVRVYATVEPVDQAAGVEPLPADWILVASNDGFAPYELFDNMQMFDRGVDPSITQARQARVPLEMFSGAEVTLRFEFSSDGYLTPDIGDIDFAHIPVRQDEESTDNTVDEDADNFGDFYRILISNTSIYNTERGEIFDNFILSEEDLSPTPPLFVFDAGLTGQAANVVTGNYQLYIRPSSGAEVVDFVSDGRNAQYDPPSFDTDGIGDTNRRRDQGQLVLHSNRITDSNEYGIRIQSEQGVAAAAADLVITNAEKLIRGPVIENNVIANSGVGGILFAGADSGYGATHYGRITNNTIVGGSGGVGDSVGIEVGLSASPTLLNNIVAYNRVGISVVASSSSTEIAGTLFHENTENGPLGTFPLVSDRIPSADGSDGLFRNPMEGNFLLVPGAIAIDSAINSEEDRPSIVSVSSSLGIDYFSPILAPDRDGRGQLRVDDPDVEALPGLGSNVIKDRGALEQADAVGPRAELLTPFDNDSNDFDNTVNSVSTNSGPFGSFEIRLFDVDISGNDLFGTGIDDSTVLTADITIRRDNELLTEGVDYTLSYNATSDILTFIPLAGVWIDGTYQINIGPGVTDLAGNPLSGNNVFFIDTQPAPLNPWQNPTNPLDVNNDGNVAPIDAIQVINELNLIDGYVADPVTGELPAVPGNGQVPPFVDVNGDGFVSPLDALLVINQLNNASRTPQAPLSSVVVAGMDDGSTRRSAAVLSQSEVADAVSFAFEGLGEDEDEDSDDGPWWLS